MRKQGQRNRLADGIAVILTMILLFVGFLADAQTPTSASAGASAAPMGATGTPAKTPAQKAGLKKTAKKPLAKQSTLPKQTKATAMKPAMKSAARSTPAKPVAKAAAATTVVTSAAKPVVAQQKIVRPAKTTGVLPPNEKTAVNPTNPKSKAHQKVVTNQIQPAPVKRAQKTTAENTATASRTDSKATSTLTAAVPAPKPQAPPTFAFVGQIAHSHSLYDHQDGTVQDANDYILVPMWRFASKWKASLILDYTQDTRNPEASDWSDSQFGIMHDPWKVGGPFTVGLGVVGVHATSKKSSLVSESYGGVGGAVSLGFTEGALPTGLSLGASVSLIRMLNQKEESTEGAVNKAWSSVQTYKGGYNYGRLGLSVTFYHINGITYQDNLTEKFWHVEELGYDVTKNLNFAIGHTLMGPALKANAIDSNIAVTDENNSLVYAQLTIGL